MDWKEMDVEELVKDATSSSGDTLYGAIDMATVYEQVMATRQMKKQFQNAHYGKSIIESRRFELSKRLDGEIRNFPHAVRMSARDTKGFTDLLHNAIHHVRKNNYSTDGYKWFINMKTMDMVRHLYDDHFERAGMAAGVNPDKYAYQGIEFVMGNDIEPGQILLADEEFIKRKPIRSHAFVLIEDVDDGYPTEIDLSVGGEMELYTIQK